VKYLFRHWDEVCKKVRDKDLFIFLDFDGTLAPIVRIPEKARLPQETRELLKNISELPKRTLAFISGRSLEDIKKKIGLDGVIYSGNHGLEIEGPRLRFNSVLPPGTLKSLAQIKKDLEGAIVEIQGAVLEDKGFSLSLHFRRVKAKDLPRLKTAFHEAVIPSLASGNIQVKPGKKVLEVRPSLEWDKGRVVLWLLGRQRFIKERTLPVYLGDDVTDEDAFKALEGKGLTIFVGKPRRSQAHYYIKNPGEVREFLKRVLCLN
jgi:trehalose 6-phosphate phosphatase